MNRTRLATHTELAYDKLVWYLEWMKTRELLNENGGTVNVLPKGVETYDKLVEWILKYIGKLKFNRRK